MIGGGIGKGRDERRRMEGRSGVENERARGGWKRERDDDADGRDDEDRSGRKRDRGESGRSSEGGKERGAPSDRGWKGAGRSSAKERAEDGKGNGMSTRMGGMTKTEAVERGIAERADDRRRGEKKGARRATADGREQGGRARKSARRMEKGTGCRRGWVG